MTKKFIILINSLINTFSKIEAGKEFEFSIRSGEKHQDLNKINVGDYLIASLEGKVYYHFNVVGIDDEKIKLKKTFEIEKSIDYELNEGKLFQEISDGDYNSICYQLFSAYQNTLLQSAVDMQTALPIKEKNKEFSTSQSDFDFYEFENIVQDSGLVFSDILIQRFIASLQTKQFVILTGLSGSGKTKLAEAFSSWITNDIGVQQVFTKDQKLPAKQANYIVRDISSTNITVESEGKSKAVVPFELVDFWTDVIINNNFDINTPSQTIQEKVLEKYEDEMTYSKSHNSFHSILKSLALEGVALRDKVNTKSNPNKQVCMVSVGADWTNREPLLGYPNALKTDDYVRPESGVLDLILNAKNDSRNPYFLILDEMNMSHVERYFADFLSAMESVNSTISLHSRKEDLRGVPSEVVLPKNLFIIGTVNVDETTYMFSPKVLDRANVIEFRVSKDEMDDYLNSSVSLDMRNLNGKGAHMAQDFVSVALGETEKFEGLGDKLMPFFDNLQAVGAEFGYRSAFEINRFVGIYNSMNDVIDEHDAIDAAIAQKLLPKLHGSRNKLQRILVILAKQCLYDTSREDPFKDVSEDDIKYPISYKKLERMHKRIMSDGFTSFAEA